ncbi:unnamed protein product, partial [Discosporangium mesarthrocarpum]
MCGTRNRLTSALSRYRKADVFQKLPELSRQTVEFELPLDSKGAMMQSGEVQLNGGYLAKEPEATRPLVYLAVVDELGGEEYHDVMATVLTKLVEALPDGSRLGLVTMSDRLGLLDLSGSIPHLQFVDLDMLDGSGTGDGVVQVRNKAGRGLSSTGGMDLSDIMSLEELLCPVAGNRENMRAIMGRLKGVC